MPDLSPQPRDPKRPRTHPEINAYRRRTLIEGTLRSLAERGVAGTTVTTISRAAGASRGLLGHYFATKDDVLVAVLEHLFGQVSDHVRTAVENAGPCATARLSAVPAALFHPKNFNDLNRTAFLALWHETRFNTPVRKANRQLYRDYILRMDRLITAAARERGVDIDTRAAALSFIALSDGLWLGLSIHDGMLTGAQAVALCRTHLDGILDRH